MHALDEVTNNSRNEHSLHLKKTLDEKHTAATHHYRILFKKAHALKTFKAESNVLVEDLQSQMAKWSSMRRPQMVDHCKAQIEKCQLELKTNEVELVQLNKELDTLDKIFMDINATLATLNCPALQHPKDCTQRF